MAKANQELRNRQVQGPPDQLLTADEVAISEAGSEAALAVTNGASDIGIREAAKELVARTRAEQGLPPKIKDPAVVARVVALLQPIVED